MDDEYSQSGLKHEWSMLIHSFIENEAMKIDLVNKIKNSQISVESIKSLKKEFSLKRKKLNQTIEKIKIKIDQLNLVIENLMLVGSDATGLLKEIDFLNHEGEKISEEIALLDLKIKKIRELQDIELQ